jgi:hypothetical protein
MSFKIKVISNEIGIIYNLPCYWGMIRINNFSEKFTMPISWWSLQDYKQQWVEGLERIYHMGTSCLVTSAQLLPDAPFINRWILYKEQDTIYVQNHILFGKRFKERFNDEQFNLLTCYQFINPRETDTEGEYKISEWNFKLSKLNQQ